MLGSEKNEPPSPQSCFILRELSSRLVRAVSDLCEVIVASQLSK